jgi:hypothetical protein
VRRGVFKFGRFDRLHGRDARSKPKFSVDVAATAVAAAAEAAVVAVTVTVIARVGAVGAVAAVVAVIVTVITRAPAVSECGWGDSCREP